MKKYVFNFVCFGLEINVELDFKSNGQFFRYGWFIQCIFKNVWY